MCQWLRRLLLLPLIYNLIATFRVSRSFDQLVDWSFSVQIYVYHFSFIKYLAIYIFRSGKAFQRIYYSVDEKYLVAKLLQRQGFSPVLFHKLESFCCPYLHWKCGDYQQAFQSGHLSQSHTTIDVLLIRTPRADGQFIPPGDIYFVLCMSQFSET